MRAPTPAQLHARIVATATNDAERRRIEAIEACLAGLRHGAHCQFWLNRKASLSGRTPIEALARGLYDDVAQAAVDFAKT